MIIKNEGVGSLYKGLGATTFRQSTSAAYRFGTYGWTRNIFERNLKEGEELQAWHSFLAGANAGLVSATINNPIDVIKTRLQRQDKEKAKYKGTIHCFSTMIKEEGSISLLRGIVPRIFRIVPGQALLFGAYQTCYDILDKYT